MDVRTIRGDKVEAYRGMERGDWASPSAWEEAIKTSLLYMETMKIEEGDRSAKTFRRHAAMAVGVTGGISIREEKWLRNPHRKKRGVFLEFTKLQICIPPSIAASVVHYCTAHAWDNTSSWRPASKFSNAGTVGPSKMEISKTHSILEFMCALTWDGQQLMALMGAAEWLRDLER